MTPRKSIDWTIPGNHSSLARIRRLRLGRSAGSRPTDGRRIKTTYGEMDGLTFNNEQSPRACWQLAWPPCGWVCSRSNSARCRAHS